MAIIEFVDVTKEYAGGYKALDGVSFSVDPGEFVFVVGPSGAGKSTLVKLLIKEDKPAAGDIFFDGQSILSVERANVPALRRRVGVVFQDFKLLDSKNVFDNVAIALDVVNASADDIRNIVPNVLSMVGLLDKADKYPKQLSGGEKQRISIARAIAHEPDVLVADEPTGMIDLVAAEEVIEIFDRINALGTTIFMATHDKKIVDALKKRVIRLENGKIVSDKQKGTY